MKKVKALFAALYAGHRLMNPARWKEAQLWASLGVSVMALLDAFGLGFSLSDDTISALAVAIAALANGFLTVGTTNKIGLPPPDIDQESGFGDR